MYFPGQKTTVFYLWNDTMISGLCGVVSFQHFLLFSKSKEKGGSEVGGSLLQQQVADELSDSGL